jgi:ribonucleoside-diphosphate reductase alpha chain
MTPREGRRGLIQVDISQRILSDIVVFNKYAKYIPELGRRETWEELCNRNIAMHVKKYPHMEKELVEVYSSVYSKQVLPSMRSMQFGGAPIDLANNRIYNCAYAAADHPAIFHEAMFLLLGGTGFGYSVQTHHIEQLPVIQGPLKRPRRFLIGDSIEGWADAIKVLMKAYFQGKSDPVFDYRDIREKGAELVTSGGKAPGPDPLRICINQIKGVLNGSVGRKLRSIEIHDILCYIADAVLSGGIRRAAMIALFSPTDMDMLYCKSGLWYEKDPQRGRSNNSVVLVRGETQDWEYDKVWEIIERNGTGEPGVFWTNDRDVGTNPCAEISLKNCQMCNLTEMNVSDIESQKELNNRARKAAFIGTLQAGYTDFHYLRNKWRETCEKEALIGVGQTGIASGKVLNLSLVEAAQEVVKENRRVANLIGINYAARTTTVKPSGTSSLTVGSSSGIHGWHNDFYIRRMRVGKNEPLYGYMLENFPNLIEDCVFKPHLEAVMSFPQRAPEGAILRTESYMALLERVRKFNVEWVRTGHRDGINYHNVSCTISLKSDEWEECGDWMWENQDYYTGIAVLPYNGDSYEQAPFEDCTEETYHEMMTYLKEIDLTQVVELTDNTELTDQVACGGGTCEF